MINLKNKVALITGGSRGIGKACVKIFSNAEADVAFTYISQKNHANKPCTSLKNNSKIEAYRVNIFDEKQIKSLIKNIENEFGKIDILVNNAGIWEESEIGRLG